MAEKPMVSSKEKRYSGATHGPMRPITADNLCPVPGSFHEYVGVYRIMMGHSFEINPLELMKSQKLTREHIEMVAELINYKVRERLIRDGLATLIDGKSSIMIEGHEVIPSRIIKKPIMIVPYEDFHEWIKLSHEEDRFVTTRNEVDWEEFV